MVTKLLRLVFALFIVVAVFPRSLWACPFCSPVEGDTLLSEVDNARSIVLGMLVRQPSMSAEGDNSRKAGFGIAQVARADANLDLSAMIDVQLAISAQCGSRHLLLQMPDESGTWQQRYISSEGWDFVRAAAGLPAITKDMSVLDRTRRLTFCLPHLVSDSETLSNSAYAEFAAAPYEAVRALAPHLDSRQLKTWIMGEERTSTERSMMFTLLGVCADTNDIAFVRDALEDGLKNKSSTELAAIIAAWLSITRDQGLDEIDRRLLLPEDVPSTNRRAAVEALRFHVNVDGSRIGRSRLLTSVRLLLSHPRAADFIIYDLAEWEDWQSLDAILALWKEHAKHCEWLRQPILTYLKACPLPVSRSTLHKIQMDTQFSRRDDS